MVVVVAAAAAVVVVAVVALELAPAVVVAAQAAGCPHKLPLRVPLMHKNRGLSGIAKKVS